MYTLHKEDDKRNVFYIKKRHLHFKFSSCLQTTKIIFGNQNQFISFHKFKLMTIITNLAFTCSSKYEFHS